MHIKETATSAEIMSEFEPWRGREASMRTMWKEISWTVLDTELHIASQRFTERRMERRQKGNGKGTQKGGKFKGGKGGYQGKGKGKGKKGHRLNEFTEQKYSGQVDLGNNGQNNLGMLKQTLRVGGMMIGIQQIRILRPQRQLRNFNMCLSVICDSRIWVLPNTLNLFNLTDWIFHSEPSQLVLIPLHAKLLFLPITLQHMDFWSTKISYLDVRTALQAETKCMTKERGSCVL